MIKDYLEEKAEEVIDKMDKTPFQKLIVVILAIVFVGSVGIGYLQIKWSLEKPFLEDKLVEDKAKIRGPREFYDFYIKEQKNKDNLTNLQKQDSDGDTLTDYQELYIYKTNAYSEDTDSDGVPDAQEVALGTDPNCPGSSICDSEGFVLKSNIPVDNTDTAPAPTDTSQLDKLSPKEKEQITTYFKSLDNNSIRLMLVQQGYAQEQVDKLTDEQLQGALNDILNTL